MNLALLVVLANLAVEADDAVFAISVNLLGVDGDVVEGVVMVAPELEALDGSNSGDVAVGVFEVVDVCPGEVEVEEGDHLTVADVELELDGGGDGGEFVVDGDVLVVDACALVGGIADAVGEGEG